MICNETWEQLAKRKKERRFSTVSIPTPLFKKVQERIKDTGFTSVSSYVEYVLREIMASEREEGEEREPFTREDEERIKRRLRALGYLP
jgi:Arc/MetJ-type ribon-helix-helix transcriptional regulator